MASGRIGAVTLQFQRLFGVGTVSGMSEGQLLTRFVEKGDEAAFESLVGRFGPMVMGVCRRWIDDPHVVDDAFQATFLVLVRRAGSIRDRDLLGNWIYGVALRVAKKSRADLVRRRSRENEGADLMAGPLAVPPELEDPDLGPILHEELARLPEKYRAPVVLCYLDGRTHEEAARLLRWPVGTVKGRLSRAKELLRGRLGRRGVTASTTVLAASLARTATAVVPPLLLDQTVKAAMALAAGGAVVAGLASAGAVALSERVVTGMILSKMKVLATTAVLAGTLGIGVGVMARQGFGPAQDEGRTTKQTDVKTVIQSGHADPVPRTNEKVTTETTKSADLPGLTTAETSRPARRLPSGLEGPDYLTGLLKSEPPVKDLPTPKALADRRVEMARADFNRLAMAYSHGAIRLDSLVEAAKDLTQARLAATEDQADRARAVEDQVRVLRALVKEEPAMANFRSEGEPHPRAAELALVDAEILLHQVRGGMNVAARSQPGGLLEEDEDDLARNEALRQILNRPLSMPFPNETPLEEVLKYIRTATMGEKMQNGIPIYVDPKGLEDVEKTMASPITFQMEDVKLKTSLRLILKQLGLGYYLREGMVIVTSTNSDDYMDAIHPEWRKRNAQAGLGGMGGGGFGGGRGFGGGGGVGGSGNLTPGSPGGLGGSKNPQ